MKSIDETMASIYDADYVTVPADAEGESFRTHASSLLQVRHVVPFRERLVGAGEDLARLRGASGVVPQAGEAGRGSQLPRARAVPSRDRYRSTEAGFGCLCCRDSALRFEQLALEPVRLGLVVALLSLLRM